MARINFRVLASLLAIVFASAMPLEQGTAQAQAGNTRNCVIASNDGKKGFRTDEITRCRVNTENGSASYVFKGKSGKRSYTSRQPLTKRHLDAANYWLNRVEKLQLSPSRNPAGFDPKVFLSEAAKATSGAVFIRSKNGKRSMNVVYMTNGVYRSIDFPGTDLKATPSGFLTTGQR